MKGVPVPVLGRGGGVGLGLGLGLGLGMGLGGQGEGQGGRGEECALDKGAAGGDHLGGLRECGEGTPEGLGLQDF